MRRCPLWQTDSRFKSVLLLAKEYISCIQQSHVVSTYMTHPPKVSADKIIEKIEMVCREMDEQILGLKHCKELEGGASCLRSQEKKPLQGLLKS